MESLPNEPIKRWTAKRRSALVLNILQGETSVQEAARKHGLTVAEIEDWRNRFGNTTEVQAIDGLALLTDKFADVFATRGAESVVSFLSRILARLPFALPLHVDFYKSTGAQLTVANQPLDELFVQRARFIRDTADPETESPYALKFVLETLLGDLSVSLYQSEGAWYCELGEALEAGIVTEWVYPSDYYLTQTGASSSTVDRRLAIPMGNRSREDGGKAIRYRPYKEVSVTHDHGKVELVKNGGFEDAITVLDPPEAREWIEAGSVSEGLDTEKSEGDFSQKLKTYNDSLYSNIDISATDALILVNAAYPIASNYLGQSIGSWITNANDQIRLQFSGATNSSRTGIIFVEIKRDTKYLSAEGEWIDTHTAVALRINEERSWLTLSPLTSEVATMPTSGGFHVRILGAYVFNQSGSTKYCWIDDLRIDYLPEGSVEDSKTIFSATRAGIGGKQTLERAALLGDGPTLAHKGAFLTAEGDGTSAWSRTPFISAPGTEIRLHELAADSQLNLRLDSPEFIDEPYQAHPDTLPIAFQNVVDIDVAN